MESRGWVGEASNETQAIWDESWRGGEERKVMGFGKLNRLGR